MAPPHLAVNELSDAFRRGMGTVSGPESVVDVVVTQSGQLLAEFLIVALSGEGGREGGKEGSAFTRI